MTGPRPTGVESELERRLTILSNEEETDRRLPMADTATLAAITFGSFVAVVVTQAL